MGNAENIHAALLRLSEALQSLAGTIPMDRALRAEPDVLPTLRQAGMTWRQIAHLAAKAGIRGKRGEVVQAAHWRSLSSRLCGAELRDVPNTSRADISVKRNRTSDVSSRKPIERPTDDSKAGAHQIGSKKAIKAELMRLSSLRRSG